MLIQASQFLFLFRIPIQLASFILYLANAPLQFCIQSCVCQISKFNFPYMSTMGPLFHTFYPFSKYLCFCIMLKRIRVAMIDVPMAIMQLAKILTIALTVYKIPILCKIISISAFRKWKNIKEKTMFTKEIDEQLQQGVESFAKIFSGIIIFALVMRIKSAMRRIQKYNIFYQLKQEEFEKKNKPILDMNFQRNALNKLNWIVYGKVCQFLAVQDFATLSQVSRKFNELSMKEYYWEYQYKRDWFNYQSFEAGRTFREKCINTFRQANPQLIAIRHQEKQDKLFGSVYIMFDEAIKSFKTIPYLILTPANIFGLLLLKTFRPVRPNEHYLYLRCDHFIDAVRYDIAPATMRWSPFEVLNPTWNNFSILYLDLARWILIAVLKYVCELGHILGYLGYIIIKQTNAGDFNDILVQIDQETEDFTIRRVGNENNEVHNVYKRYLLYWMQLILSCGYLYLLLIIFALLPTSLHYYFNWDWYTATIGPCFICLIHYFALLNVLVSVMTVISQSASFFKPWRAISMTVTLLKHIRND